MREHLLKLMTSEKVEDFGIRILDSPDLAVSIAHAHAPWSVHAEQ